MARVLVIGGTLFIGRRLVERLLERGDDVTILHRGRSRPFEGRAAEIACDRNDARAVAEAIAGGDYELVFDNVYDWARGTTSEPVEAAARACGPRLERYVFMSSVAAYFEGLDRDEDDPLAPPDCPDAYCRNKADAERALFRLRDEIGLPATTLRPPFIYGPGNPFHREQFFWDRLTAGRPILIPDDGSRLMQLVLVDDLVEAALRAAERDAAVGRAYNIAEPAPLTQLEFVQALAEAAGLPLEAVFTPREKLIALGGDAFRPPFYFGQYLDVPPITQRADRARRELDFAATPRAEGLRRTWENYRKGERPEPDFAFDDRVLAASRG